MSNPTPSVDLERLVEALNASGRSASILPGSKKLAVWLPVGNEGREARVIWEEEECPRLAFAMLDVLERAGLRYVVQFSKDGKQKEVLVWRPSVLRPVPLKASAEGLTKSASHALIAAHSAGLISKPVGGTDV